MIDWDRRRRNIRILCAAHDVTPTALARAKGMSANTLTKFLNSKTDRGLSPEITQKVLSYFGLSEAADLDTDNPLADPKITLRKIIDGLNEDEARILKRELESRFS